jgi:segregation and condensation protein A
MAGLSMNEGFDAVTPIAAEDTLIVDLDGYEGPLDALLALAREQKVDLTRISILKLAEQYLAFIGRAHHLRLEIAADYLVMAAWLAYLKSRLLLPEPPADDEPSGGELAEMLREQLRQLEAMRQAGARLMSRDRVGLQMFPRGMPEGVRLHRRSVYQDGLYDLLKAYGEFRSSRGSADVLPFRLARAQTMTLDDAMGRLRSLLGNTPDWTALQSFLPVGLSEAMSRRSALAATFAACLEVSRRGEAEIRQIQPFGPIFIRRAANPPPDPDLGDRP